ncbi:hypothetical protein FQA39_LY18010 [Lamprigera yunnana]|nr:hypothetical protein FQA39_LY18010 [Lamprigera yunnana]
MKYLRLLLNQKNVRIYSTNATLDPIKMAFASYESTITHIHEPPPPLVIMHGVLGSKANWNSMCKALHKHTIPQRKIIAVDARNHGDSPHSEQHTYPHLAEDVKNLLEELKIKKACMLGHSMGGRVMMYFALKHPNLVDKLIIEDMSPTTTSRGLKTMPMIFTALQNVHVKAQTSMSTARLDADMQLAHTISDKGLRSFLLTNLVQKSDGSFTWRINLPVLLHNFTKHIAGFPKLRNTTFNGPVLFIAGGVSDFIQKSDHDAIQQLFPQAEFQVIEGAGHWVHSEKPNDFLKACLTFLNK